MSWQGPEFVIAIIAISTAGWLLNNWIRARNGYSLEDEWGGKTDPQRVVESDELREQNKALNGKLDAMTERMIVLEKIVTDRGYSVAEEIEALRNTPSKQADSGVPLNMGKQEKA